MTEGIDRMREIQRKTFDNILRLSFERIDNYIADGKARFAETEFWSTNGAISAAMLLGVIGWDDGEALRKALWDEHHYIRALGVKSRAAESL